MKNIAIFPGSFDPITVGHVSIIKRALPLFGQVIIAIGMNIEKKTMFTIEQRMEWIRQVFKDETKVSVETYSGLTVDFCKQKEASFILRGLRTAADFEFERGIGQINRELGPGIETLFLLTEACHTPISSSIVRDVIRHDGDVSSMVPEVVNNDL
ncbi:MAG: pantetheine-phosphate adenylyltransferase [Bacteroidetes bacterium]|nr:MAG: pantetheine-phosphate adenylyltransferase [Bacteroidota bacterium]